MSGRKALLFIQYNIWREQEPSGIIAIGMTFVYNNCLIFQLLTHNNNNNDSFFSHARCNAMKQKEGVNAKQLVETKEKLSQLLVLYRIYNYAI